MAPNPTMLPRMMAVRAVDGSALRAVQLDKAEAHEGHVDRGDAEQDTECHRKSFSVDN